VPFAPPPAATKSVAPTAPSPSESPTR
jgi:hypothetical protein